MPAKEKFKTHEAYLAWYRAYFNKNREKRREYNREWMRESRAIDKSVIHRSNAK